MCLNFDTCGINYSLTYLFISVAFDHFDGRSFLSRTGLWLLLAHGDVLKRGVFNCVVGYIFVKKFGILPCHRSCTFGTDKTVVCNVFNSI